MIVREIIENNLIRKYSDIGWDLLQVETGIRYSEAIDCVEKEYVEVEPDPEPEEDTETIEDN